LGLGGTIHYYITSLACNTVAACDKTAGLHGKFLVVIINLSNMIPTYDAGFTRHYCSLQRSSDPPEVLHTPTPSAGDSTRPKNFQSYLCDMADGIDDVITHILGVLVCVCLY
jgi:hypothetical protein